MQPRGSSSVFFPKKVLDSYYSKLYVDSMQQLLQVQQMAELRIRDVPNNIKKAFKQLCVEDDVSMNQQVIELIKAYLIKRGKDT